MEWDALTFQIPLDRPPEIANLGVGLHGHLPMERYLMQGLWCLHLYGYWAQLLAGETVLPIRPGYVSVVAPGVPVEYRYRGMSRHLFVHFRMPAGGPGATPVPIRAMQDVLWRRSAMEESLHEAIRWNAHNPVRASAILWDLLWKLAEVGDAGANGREMHPALQAARQWIEEHLAERIVIPELARRADVSHAHLTRLFRQKLGTTVMGYIRQRRMERAAHLLRASTLPVKAIAHQVGIGDLHSFNKTVRGYFGQSPRRIRQRMG